MNGIFDWNFFAVLKRPAVAPFENIEPPRHEDTKSIAAAVLGAFVTLW